MSFRVDAVEIMNRFTEYSPSRGETPLPLPIPGFWFKRICALADWIAKAENQNDDLNAQVAALQATLEEEGHRNAVFTACLHKAQNLYLEAHPDYPGWPDGAVNITWVLEAFDKERAEVKRLQTALAAANEDAERLASSLENDAYPFPIRRSIDEKDAALRAHRARVGGGK